MSSLVPISLRDPFFDDPHFSSSRSDFEDRRRQMMRDAKDFWSKVDADNITTRHNRFDDPFDPYVWGTTTRYTTTDLEPTSTRVSSYTSGGRDSQVMRIHEDENKFEITMNVQNYRPDELKVRTQPDNTIVIEGKHEERSGDSGPGTGSATGSGTRTSRYSNPTSSTSSYKPGGGRVYEDSNNKSFKAVLQQFSRSYTLPPECDPLKVVSNLSRDGVMVITAPKTKKRNLESGSSRAGNIPIPITR